MRQVGATNLYLYPGLPGELLLASLDASPEWAIVSAARDPWYRKLFAGAKAPGPGDSEYYAAQRGHRLYLNMVDAESDKYFSDDMMDAAIEFMTDEDDAGRKIFVHCNMGISRSPSLVMLYLTRSGLLPADFESAILAFKHLYPFHQPRSGIRAWLKANWSRYIG